MALEISVKLMLLVPVHVDLLKKLKVWLETSTGADVLHPVKDLSAIGAGLLLIKNIARKAEHNETLSSILGIKCIQSIVVVGQASVSCYVDDQHKLSFIIAQFNRLIFMNVHERKVIDSRAIISWLVTLHHHSSFCNSQKTAKSSK